MRAVNINPNATPEQIAEAWSKMNKRQRMAFLRAGNRLSTTSAERTQAVNALRAQAAAS